MNTFTTVVSTTLSTIKTTAETPGKISYFKKLGINYYQRTDTMVGRVTDCTGSVSTDYYCRTVGLFYIFGTCRTS